MKRFALFALLVFGICALASAQGRSGHMQGNGWGPGYGRRMPGHNQRMQYRESPRAPRLASEEVTVAGELTIVQGSPAVKNGDITYFVGGLSRYIGFIDSLKDGARVSLEGTAVAMPQNENFKILRVRKLTVGGKEYDLGRYWPNSPDRPAPAQPGRRR